MVEARVGARRDAAPNAVVVGDVDDGDRGAAVPASLARQPCRARRGRPARRRGRARSPRPGPARARGRGRGGRRAPGSARCASATPAPGAGASSDASAAIERQPQVERLGGDDAARSRRSARRCSRTARAWRAAIEPIETWSSWLARRRDRVDRRRVGQHLVLARRGPRRCTGRSSSRTRRRTPRARNGGSPPLSRASTSSAVRRSLIEPSSATASLAKSRARAIGSPWKLPPLMTRPPPVAIVSASATPPPGKTSGLSVAELSSMSRTRRRWSSASRTAPWTCGTQRSEYGSWTLCAWPWWAALEPAVAQQVAQLGGHRDLAGMRPGQLVGRGERDVRARAAPRRDIAAATLAVRTSRSASARSSAPIALIIWVPLSSARPSLASRVSGSRPDLAQGDQRRHDLAVELDLAAPDERQGEVGERREVARRADAALLRARPGGSRPRGSRAAGRRAAAGSRCGRAPACWPAAGASPGRPRAGTARPTPAAWLIRRFSWSRPASAGAMNVVARSPNPVVTP